MNICIDIWEEVDDMKEKFPTAIDRVEVKFVRFVYIVICIAGLGYWLYG